MAGELVSFGIQKLWHLLSQEYAQFKGLDDQVAELRSDLNLLNSFMKDADAKIHTSAIVRNCLEEVKGVICDAEDIIENFLFKEKFGETGGIKKRIRRLACVITDRKEIALDIGGISKRISKVVSVMQSFQIKQIIDDGDYMQPLQERKRQIRQEFARDIERNPVGLQENVKKLLGYLVEEDDVQVVSITGMGGLGKTTLARQAFNHKMVEKKFDRFAWVCVSQLFQRKNVWQKIYLNFTPREERENVMTKEETILQGELFHLLENSNSLIVLDDIWKEEDWDLIKPIFPFKPGSKVLLTSRNESVVGRGVTCRNIKQDCLSEPESWTLFQRTAMPIKDASELTDDDKNMETMGRQMIKQCQGLPLAIKVLGSLLAVKYRVNYWKRVSMNIGSHIVGRNYFSDDHNNSIYHVLSLSFEELPGYLKYCFLYLAHFPEDYEIKVEDLAYFWAAEGVLRYDNGDSIRDVGDSCIEELVKRNMVISERDKNTWRFETCRLHDLMREICLSKAKEENFLHTVGTSSPTSHSQSLNTSRRFVSHDAVVEKDINNSKVRSLVVIVDSRWSVSNLGFTWLKFLRVLHLRGAQFKGGRLPNSIGKLIHLRYLNLKVAWVYHLPSSLQKLKLLIFLNLDGIECIYLPTHNFLSGMKELRYLALPLGMPKKTKWKLNNLVNLETLVNFSTEYYDVEDLRGMARLRTLQLRITDKTSLKNLSELIAGLRHLENVDIKYEGAKGTKEWSTLLEFNNLKRLKLVTRIPLLSDELQFPSRLTSLHLYESGLKEDPMPILEKLSQLKEVILGGRSFCGRRMVCSKDGFLQLQKLELWRLEEWEEWIVEERSMPLLHSLVIWGCKKLKELPDGLRFITSLEDLEFNGMREGWKKSLSEEGEDYYKVKHIPSVKFD